MWLVVIGSVLMCLELTWCDPFWLVLSWCVWIKPDMIPLCWCDPIVVKNLKDSKNFKVPKNNSKLQEGCHLRKKFKVQKRNSKFKRENGT